MQTQSIESLLDAKVREYQTVLDRKDKLAEQTKDNNAKKEEMEKEIAQMMVDNEKPSTIVDGYAYSLKQETMYSKKAEETLQEAGVVFFDVLREQGLGNIIVEKVDQRTLNSTMKALVEEQGELPEELAECLSVYEKLGVGRRKANTKALERAKQNKEGK